MRLTEFWRRMDEHFGAQSRAFARDRVLNELGSRTVEEALAQGDAAKDVWRAVCVEADIPPRKR
ncbi:MAG: DUF3046 domain-containing protein [Actinomycetota bacterium]|nr:DUF3046 domain-containing protein [Actinomycetota bacterium]